MSNICLEIRLSTFLWTLIISDWKEIQKKFFSVNCICFLLHCHYFLSEYKQSYWKKLTEIRINILITIIILNIEIVYHFNEEDKPCFLLFLKKPNINTLNGKVVSRWEKGHFWQWKAKTIFYWFFRKKWQQH